MRTNPCKRGTSSVPPSVPALKPKTYKGSAMVMFFACAGGFRTKFALAIEERKSSRLRRLEP